MGMQPQIVAATSNTMIFFTTMTASTSYLANGSLDLNYTILMLIIGIVSNLIGHYVIGYFIRKYNQTHLITVLIGLLIGVSAILMSIELYNKSNSMSTE